MNFFYKAVLPLSHLYFWYHFLSVPLCKCSKNVHIKAHMMKTSKNFHNLPNDDASSQRLISNHKELFSQNKTSTSQKKIIFAENVAGCRNISTSDPKLLCFVKLSLCFASLVRGSLQCGHLTVCKKEGYRLMYMRQLHILFN